jgi:hypothetical protein
MTRFEDARRFALDYADALIDRIKSRELNASAFEGLMRSYLEQPAYDATFRAELLRLCMERL